MNRNPYAPPQAAVADLERPLVMVARPPAVTLAIRLLWCSLALGTLSSILGQVLTSSAGVVSVVIGLALGAWVTHKVSQGRNWARIASLVVFLVAVAAVVLQLTESVQRSVFVAITEVASYALHGLALYLVFTGAGARWFARGKHFDEPGA